MEITTKDIEERFRRYNKDYFAGELPTPRFGLIESYTTCGYFSCSRIVGRRRLRGQLIEISSYYDWEEDELRDVIVHEMIHYYLAYKHIDNTISHGDAFREMADEFNSTYGLNIREKVDCTKFRKTKNAPKIKWFLTQLFY